MFLKRFLIQALLLFLLVVCGIGVVGLVLLIWGPDLYNSVKGKAGKASTAQVAAQAGGGDLPLLVTLPVSTLGPMPHKYEEQL